MSSRTAPNSTTGGAGSATRASIRPDRLRVQDADFVGKYIALHDCIFSRGRLDHGFSAARDGQQLWPVLRWDGTRYQRIAGPEH